MAKVEVRDELVGVRSDAAPRSRGFSGSSALSRLARSSLAPPNSFLQRWQVTSLRPIDRIASADDVPCAVITSARPSFTTTSSGLCLFLEVDPSSRPEPT